MPEVKTIAVMGATGKQGRGVINALLFSIGSVQYKVRPLTRSVTSKAAQDFSRDYPQLSLVEWHPDDTESLKRGFEGCYGAFITTSPSLSPGTSIQDRSRSEIELGKRCLEAAEAASLSHIIYTTFPSIFNASNGKINVRRFETKHQIALEIWSSSMPSTILCPGPFYTDFQHTQYAYWEGGKVIFSTPAAASNKMGFADPSHDIGWFARAAFEKGPSFMAGQELPVCGESISYADLATKFTAVTGVKADYRQCSVEEFEARFQSYHEPDRKDMASLGKWLTMAPSDRACYGTMELEPLLTVDSEMRVKALSWEAFLERTRWAGPLRKD